MKFSICIPNYNYARYIGETIESVRRQQAEIEILVSDNCSTDDSVAVVEAFDDPRIKLHVNRGNVGFAGNLDRACQDATGDRMLLLSSDDLARPDAFGTYAALAEALGPAADRAIFSSGYEVIDGDGIKTGEAGLDRRLWPEAERDEALSAAVGAPVYRHDAARLLQRSLELVRTPFSFASTCYPRGLYEQLEGYGGGYMFNPDKMFAWKLMSAADQAFFVDRPLFAYRVHANNQAALQREAGALKHLMDQYRATFDTAPEVLERAGFSREDMARAFVEQDIGLRGLKMVAEGERTLARRGVDFGKAAYPAVAGHCGKVRILRALLALGPLGTMVARPFYRRAMASYEAQGAANDTPGTAAGAP
ncbi:glycosyltransferase family 2 protein [Pelagerythrobacter sp.]|uniref:glycosyltransferase family 2 protein n=1 Tax=Pelagerythrobacter sp. TaxID=2800702 RepID=UPI0035B232B8